MIFPLQIGQFKFTQEYPFMGIRTSTRQKNRPYQFGIYQNSKGQRAFAKLYLGPHSGFHYHSLWNEIRVYRSLENYLPYISHRFPKIRTPKFFATYQDTERLLLLIEFIPGKRLSSFTSEKKVEVYSQIVPYLKELTPFIADTVQRRSPFTIISFFPFIVVLAIYRKLSFIHQIISATWVFLSNSGSLFSTHNLTFVHRSLEPQNIIIYAGKIWIVDFQLACLSIPNLEICQTLLFSWYDKSFRDTFLSSPIFKRVLSSPTYRSQCLALSAYLVLVEFSQKNPFTHTFAWDYLAHLQKVLKE